MKKYIIVSLFTLFSVSQINAQVPGYLGKRFIAGASLGTIINLSNPNANLNSGLTSFSLQGSVSAEYVLSRSVGVGFMGSYSRTGCQSGGSFSSGATRLNIMEVGPYFNFYSYNKRGAIAPLGSYFTLGCNMFSYTPSVPDGTTFSQPYYNSDQWARLYGVHPYITFGKRWLIKDHFMPSFSITTGFYFTSYTVNPENSYGYAGYGNPYVDAEVIYRNKSATRLLQYGLFTMNIGLSYLIF